MPKLRSRAAWLRSALWTSPVHLSVNQANTAKGQDLFILMAGGDKNAQDREIQIAKVFGSKFIEAFTKQMSRGRSVT